MSDKVIPTILCGTKKLILSETLMFMPDEKVEIVIPAASPEGKAHYIKLMLEFIEDGGKVTADPIIKENVFTLKIYNIMRSSFPSGLPDWFPFSIGSKKFALLVGVTPIANKSGQLTVSIYEVS